MRFSGIALLVFMVQLNTLPAQDLPEAPTWEQLLEVREKSFTRIKAIIDEAQQATPEQRVKLQEEYTGLVTRLQEQVFPGLAAGIYNALAANPEDETTLEVAGEVMQLSYSQNNYTRAGRIASSILKLNAEDPLAMNMLGVAAFAEHDFETAFKTLSAAKEKGILLGDLGGRYLDSAQNYIEYWQKEEAIRQQEAALPAAQQLPRVKLQTARGDIVIELFENEAPNTVANFVNLVEKKFYDGLTFHRVLSNFMAQGGCPNSKTNPAAAGTGGPGYNIKCEAYEPNARRHFAGSLSMAHAGRDTGGSQFFITHLPTPHLDREIAPSSVHTVFGRVVEGLDVVRALEANDKIETAVVLRKRDHEYVPQTIAER